MGVVPSEVVNISNLETRSKKREDHVLGKDKKLIPSGEIVIADKLDRAKVQMRKRTRNGEKRKTTPWLHPGPNILGTSSLPPIMEEGTLMKETWVHLQKYKLLTITSWCSQVGLWEWKGEEHWQGKRNKLLVQKPCCLVLKQ